MSATASFCPLLAPGSSGGGGIRSKTIYVGITAPVITIFPTENHDLVGGVAERG